MSDAVPSTHVTVSPPGFMAQIDWTAIAKGVAVFAIGAAIFWMEMTGHADKGTFISTVAWPVLGMLGVNHLVTKFQGASPNA